MTTATLRHPTSVWIWTLSSLAIALLLMEPYAAWIHRVVWHGPLWPIHRSHHRERIDGGSLGGLVANDALSAAHAPASMALIAWGFFGDGVAASLAMGAGLGMGLFGALYVVFHDGMVHGRLPIGAFGKLRPFAAMKEAHARHHRTNGAPFGFFASPLVEPASRGGALAERRKRDGTRKRQGRQPGQGAIDSSSNP